MQSPVVINGAVVFHGNDDDLNAALIKDGEIIKTLNPIQKEIVKYQIIYTSPGVKCPCLFWNIEGAQLT